MKKLRWINKGAQFVPIKIERAEKQYKATYIADLCIRNKNGSWTDDPVAVFYDPNPDFSKGHSHYFGLFVRDGMVYVVGATSAVEDIILGVEADDGEIIFSRFRHDYRETKDRTGMVDGGRDYFKTNGCKTVRLKVVGPDFEILEDDGATTEEK